MPGFGRFDTRRFALEKTSADLCLQLGNASRKRWLADAESQCSPAEIPVVGQGAGVSQQSQVDLHAQKLSEP